MKILSRDFTTKEKVLILLLALVLLFLAYYQFVDQPVRNAISSAEAEKAALEVELTAVDGKIAQLERMQNEIDELSADGKLSLMPSYNNSSAVNALLNDVLGSMGYSITFSNVTRDGDQIRRNISLQFTAPNYDSVKQVMSRLTGSEYRCLLGDVRCATVTGNGRTVSDAVTVSLTATFYETMVGGTADAGLPETSAAAT